MVGRSLSIPRTTEIDGLSLAERLGNLCNWVFRWTRRLEKLQGREPAGGRHEVGQRIVAAKSFGGFARPSVPKGAQGIIAKTGLTETTAVFVVKRWWSLDLLELVRIEGLSRSEVAALAHR